MLHAEKREVFQCATLKNWVRPGYEARWDVDLVYNFRFYIFYCAQSCYLIKVGSPRPDVCTCCASLCVAKATVCHCLHQCIASVIVSKQGRLVLIEVKKK